MNRTFAGSLAAIFALLGLAATLNGDLAAKVTALANYFLANAVQINALFAKFNILTPCTSSLCP